MPALTTLQARDYYIINSMAQFLGRKVKTAYDIEVALTFGANEDISKALTIDLGRPDDPNIATNAPIIAIDVLEGTERDRYYEVGSAIIWRHMNFVFYCYPSLNQFSTPSLTAALLLRTYMRDAFGGECIQIMDYSNPGFNPNAPTFCSEVMYIVNVTDPMNRGEKTTLALERHRFDMHVQVKYPVSESLTT